MRNGGSIASAAYVRVTFVILRCMFGESSQDDAFLSIFQPTINEQDSATWTLDAAPVHRQGYLGDTSENKNAHPPGGNLRVGAETIALTGKCGVACRKLYATVPHGGKITPASHWMVFTATSVPSSEGRVTTSACYSIRQQ